jgi:hypothetical protein
MTVKELSLYTRSPLEIRSGFNGKLLCKQYDDKKHTEIDDREVTAIWSEIRVINGGNYDSFARTVICAYVFGDKECNAEQEAAHATDRRSGANKRSRNWRLGYRPERATNDFEVCAHH